MKFYYLDASAWVKCYFQEKGSAWMRKLFAENPMLACSVLGFLEVHSALSRKVKARELAETTCREKIQELAADWRGIIQIQLSNEVLRLAELAIDQFALRAADAVHAASAQVFARQILEQGGGFAMITSDLELKNAVMMMDLAVVDPGAEL